MLPMACPSDASAVAQSAPCSAAQLLNDDRNPWGTAGTPSRLSTAKQGHVGKLPAGPGRGENQCILLPA